MRFTPYVWLPSFDGTLGAGGVEADLDLSFDELFDDSSDLFELVGEVELRHGPIALIVNPTWLFAEFDVSAELDPTIDVDAELELNLIFVDVAGALRVYDETFGKGMLESDPPRLWIDLTAGTRTTILDAKIDLDVDENVLLPPSGLRREEVHAAFKEDGEEFWVDLTVGARIGVSLNEHAALLVRGDVGGFGLGSDLSWEAFGAASLKFDLFGHDATAIIGYRALGQDYKDDGFEWDVVTHGPTIGLQVSF